MRLTYYLMFMMFISTCLARDELYNTKQELEQDIQIQQNSQNQIDFIRREYKGNPAASDLIYYKQNKAQEEIQKDTLLNIEPSREPEIEQVASSMLYEFTVLYTFKIVNDVPYGESYKISVPLVSKANNKHIAKTCEISTKETYYSLMLYPYYTPSQSQASIKKQTQYKLYDFLQEYKSDVIVCLMQHSTLIDDVNLNINLQSNTKTLASVKAHLFVSFNGGILTLNILEIKDKDN
ncbi:hypothetical protein LS73_000100 [Helicobacter muridarum]|uniref:Periplasmic protein n=1 Tax=Helicobacter muridarum TaxID=216 RepID=A0A377PUW4_9HELI|nr:hypothetical protein [Helicobacter muridarum]TLE01584.1 hypothetical protein LS73_000100 [Helicobacter muridarum]STQ86194.1 Uncharacterised protein [Helicobacter muridarum]